LPYVLQPVLNLQPLQQLLLLVQLSPMEVLLLALEGLQEPELAVVPFH
jgi:hypothetical protein